MDVHCLYLQSYIVHWFKQNPILQNESLYGSSRTLNSVPEPVCNCQPSFELIPERSITFYIFFSKIVIYLPESELNNKFIILAKRTIQPYLICFLQFVFVNMTHWIGILRINVLLWQKSNVAVFNGIRTKVKTDKGYNEQKSNLCPLWIL